MTLARRLVLAAPLTAVVLALAACASGTDAGTRVSTSASVDPASVIPSGPASPDVIAAARLVDCPATDASVPVRPNGLPDVTLPCLGTGPAVRLAGLRGTPTVLNLWASWCEPCRDELPLLAGLAESKSGVRVVGITVQNKPDQALSLLTDSGVHYASARDDDAATKAALHWSGLPMTMFVDAQGVVTYVERAPIVSGDQLRSLVALHLGVTVPA